MEDTLSWVEYYFLFCLPPQRGQSLNERICFSRSKFFHLRINPIFEELHCSEEWTGSQESCSPFFKWQSNMEASYTPYSWWNYDGWYAYIMSDNWSQVWKFETVMFYGFSMNSLTETSSRQRIESFIFIPYIKDYDAEITSFWCWTFKWPNNIFSLTGMIDQSLAFQYNHKKMQAGISQDKTLHAL